MVNESGVLEWQVLVSTQKCKNCHKTTAELSVNIEWVLLTSLLHWTLDKSDKIGKAEGDAKSCDTILRWKYFNGIFCDQWKWFISLKSSLFTASPATSYNPHLILRFVQWFKYFRPTIREPTSSKNYPAHVLALDINYCYASNRQRWSWLGTKMDISQQTAKIILVCHCCSGLSWWALLMPIVDVKLSSCQIFETRKILGVINSGRSDVASLFRAHSSSIYAVFASRRKSQITNIRFSSRIYLFAQTTL